MSIWVKLVVAAVVFAAGVATGIRWHVGQDAISAQAARNARESDMRQEVRFNDAAAVKHMAALASINNQLGNARETIARLSGRECLTPDAVRMLNAIGGEPVPAATGESAGAPAASATGGGLRFATERDVASAIAICRARYAEVSGQLDQILDIEDGRNPP